MSKRMEAILISSYKDTLIFFNIPILFDGIIVISDKATLLDDEAFFGIVKKWKNLAFYAKANGNKNGSVNYLNNFKAQFSFLRINSASGFDLSL